ncbi:hypothetical protein AAY473_023338 [Plecturocebus cupreus]
MGYTSTKRKAGLVLVKSHCLLPMDMTCTSVACRQRTHKEQPSQHRVLTFGGQRSGMLLNILQKIPTTKSYPAQMAGSAKGEFKRPRRVGGAPHTNGSWATQIYLTWLCKYKIKINDEREFEYQQDREPRKETEPHSITQVKSAVILAHSNFYLPGSRDSCASASQVAGITVETGFRHDAPAGLKLLDLSDQPASASQMLGLQLTVKKSLPPPNLPCFFSCHVISAYSGFCPAFHCKQMQPEVLPRCTCLVLNFPVIQNHKPNKRFFFINYPASGICSNTKRLKQQVFDFPFFSFFKFFFSFFF